MKRTALLTILLIAGTGCVRHRIGQDSGSGNQISKPAAPTPDESLRAIFQQQRTGAFNPITDDARIQTFVNRVKANPADVDTRLELAALYEGYRLYNEALEQYKAAFEVARSEKALLGIVRSGQPMNRNVEWVPLIEQFLKESSSDAVWNALGLIYNASGHLPEAENALRRAVGLNPGSDVWRNNLGYNLLLHGKLDAAEAEFRTAIELNPKAVTAHNNLGMLLARRGDSAGALREFEFSTDRATAHNNLAVVLMEMGKYDESREQLVQALMIRRNFAPAMANFKLVQERMRQRPDSEKLSSQPQGGVRIAVAEP